MRSMFLSSSIGCMRAMTTPELPRVHKMNELLLTFKT